MIHYRPFPGITPTILDFMNALHLTPNSIPDSFTHPVTGVVHVMGYDGWEPTPDSIPSHFMPTRWVTCKVPVPEKDRDLFLSQMVKVARGLSQITGVELEWHWLLSNENPYGDWGLFKTKFKE